MNNKSKIELYNIIKSLSYSMDLISEEIVGHHKKVAYVSMKLAQEMELDESKIHKLLISALIHDLGVFYLNQKYSDLSFDNKNNKHAEIGYRLLKKNFPINEIPEIIRYHHHDWNKQKNEVPLLSNILHLADRIVILIKDKSPILSQVDRITNTIKKNSKSRFYPEGVNKFLSLAKKEYFWLDLISDAKIEKKIDSFSESFNQKIDLNEFLKISYLTSHIIDFRSSFTATHSEGIATTATYLSKKLNFNKKNQKKIKIAGYLHDIGKLAVPPKILNKNGKLNNDEWSIMKTHTYYTYQALSTSKKLDDIKEWAAFHHEKLNGKGYPFHLKSKDISLGSKIMAVADIFTAITEDRPYRKGMKANKVKMILEDMAKKDEIDEKVVGIILDNYQEFNNLREHSQNKVKEIFYNFNKNADKIIKTPN
ncbi:MAG: HD-GYP domain-containing protein [Bacillota bacterium]